MALALVVPARNDLTWYKFRITFSGVIYTLNFRLNSRMNRWIMDIKDPAEKAILLGIPILILRNLTGQYRTLNVPQGVFFATDDSGQDTQPTLLSFGTDHTFWYVDPTQGTP